MKNKCFISVILFLPEVILLAYCSGYCIYCPEFPPFSTVKELDGVAVGKGHLLWQI